jgi:RNA polymerase sigma factor for flagellar operon FliA
MQDSPEVLARVTEALDLVPQMARQLRRRLGMSGIGREDLESHGREALLLAARSFDPTRGVPFRGWAAYRIRGAMLDAVRSRGALPKRVYREIRALEASDRVQEALLEESASAPVPTDAQADAHIDRMLCTMATSMMLTHLVSPTGEEIETVGDARATPEEQTAHRELMATVHEIVTGMPEAERDLVDRHFFQGVTLGECARAMGLSKSWSSRLLARAVEAIGRELRRRGMSGG